MSKKYKYHTSHSYVGIEGKEIKVLTQLYQIGVYYIINNDSSLQGTGSPQQMVKMEKSLKTAQEKGEISNLEFGRQIVVQKDQDGFWKEVK